MISLIHDSHSTNFRKPYGAVPFGTASCISLEAYDDEICSDYAFDNVKLVVMGDIIDATGKKAKVNKEIELTCTFFGAVSTENGRRVKYRFETEFKPDGAGVYFYYFKLWQKNGYTSIYADNDDSFGGIGRVYNYGESIKSYQLTVYKADLRMPEWFKKGVIYQIFPDRFRRGADHNSKFKPNTFVYGSWDDKPMYIKAPDGDILRWDFYGGNLMGVAEKMDYIENLGANIVYLNPIFEAVSNHRYDTGNYKKVDSLLGGDAAFDIMVSVGHSKGFKFMLDGVFSHTGNDSIYFDACEKYGGGAYHNDSSMYRDWYRFGENDDEYECWWGCKALPNVEEMCPSYLKYIIEDDDSVIKHWVRKGASGWRLDVADELPDEFIKKLRKAANEAAEEIGADEPVILGEVWEDATNKISYNKMRMYFTDSELHTVTNYLFRKYMFEFFSGECSADYTAKRFKSLEENCPKHNFYALANMTGSHDVERLMTYMLRISNGDRAKARKLVSAYAAMMFMFPGVPVIYYGDETCLEGGCDPDNRRTYPWENQDVQMIDWFSAMASFRKTNPVMQSGFWRSLCCESANGGCVFAVERYFQNGVDAFGDEVSDTLTQSALCLIRNVQCNENGDLTVCVHGLKPGTRYTMAANGIDVKLGENAKNILTADENGTVRIENMKQFAVLCENIN